MEQAKDKVLNEVLSELAAIRKEVGNLEVSLLHIEAILRKEQICKNEGLCRDVKNLALEMHGIGMALEDIIIKYFNVCDEIRKVYWSNFHGELITAVVDAYQKAEDYAWKQYGLSNIDRCFNHKKHKR